MEWVFDEGKNVWNLMDGTSIAARIFIKEKPDQKNAFHAKSLISLVYTGGKTFSRLSRKHKEWKAQNRKFHTRAEMERYLEAKKKAVQDYIERI
ncbi:MAG: hypothetical protein RDV48_02520 [Candidatus Eremiobacteraeota bacterium]|nr:hypothetical protein [Candidatus Eremiobacteraeota bacterium]